MRFPHPLYLSSSLLNVGPFSIPFVLQKALGRMEMILDTE
tara:strand:+ start:832 stop:951 length:120 start_codon:yes stop_codon:yes gene_type:complete